MFGYTLIPRATLERLREEVRDARAAAEAERFAAERREDRVWRLLDQMTERLAEATRSSAVPSVPDVPKPPALPVAVQVAAHQYAASKDDERASLALAESMLAGGAKEKDILEAIRRGEGDGFVFTLHRPDEDDSA